jgi:hypothetical protein
MAKRTSAESNSEYKKLMKENAELKAELDKLKTNTKREPKKPFNWRLLSKRISFALAGAVFVVGSVVLYLVMTLVNTDRFMAVAGPLAQQPAVQTAIADKTTTAIFTKFDVQQLATDILPPKADFLAPTITSKLQELTNTQLKNALASDSFQQTWQKSIRAAHEKFITGLKNYQGDGTIDINDVYLRLSERLKDTKLKFLAGKTLPPKIGNITLVTASWLPAAHQFVSNVPLYRVLVILIFIGLIALTVWLSTDRRRTTMQLGIMISILSVLLIVSLRILRTLAENNANPENQAAVAQIGLVFTHPFVVQLATTFVIGLAVFFVAWIGSQSKSARSLRRRMNDLFAGRIHQSIFKNENRLTLWVGKYQKILLTIVAIGFVASFIFMDLTWGNFAISAIVSLLIAFIVLIFSGKQKT